MAHNIIAALVLVSVMAAPTTVMAQAASACSLLTAQDAATLMGMPLPENVKHESLPDAQNGHDHTTVCGWFPKGYKLATADAPPERGVQLTLHTLRTPAEAQAFHKNTTEMVQEAAKSNPSVGKFSPAAGVGQRAVLGQKQIAGVHIATLSFLKGKVAAQVQVWRKDTPAGESATAASKRIADKL